MSVVGRYKYFLVGFLGQFFFLFRWLSTGISTRKTADEGAAGQQGTGTLLPAA